SGFDRLPRTRHSPWPPASPRQRRVALALPTSRRAAGRGPAAGSARMQDGAGKTAIVDGSNVAHSTEGERASLENIRVVLGKLEEEGYEPVVVVDAALRHQIDDGAAYERMVEAGAIKQAPAGTDADYFILSFARELDAVVVSNDRFKDRMKAFPEAQDRVIRYMIVNGEVVFER